MVKKISDSVKSHRGFSASCCSLDHHDPVLCIADNGILLFLNSTDNVFKLNLSASSKLCFQNIIINFNVAFKFINKLSPADLILPFRAYLPFKNSLRSFVGSRPFVIIIKKAADRSTPVIYKRTASCSFRQISDSNVKLLRLLISLINKIHPAKKRGILHIAESFPQKKLLLIGIYLGQKSLSVIKFLISVLVHFCIIFPVVFMHVLDFSDAGLNGSIYFFQPFFKTCKHLFQIFLSGFFCLHTLRLPQQQYR